MDWSSATLGALIASAVIFATTAAALWPMLRRAFLGWVVLRMIALVAMILALHPALSLWGLNPTDRILIGRIAGDLSLAVCGPLLASYVEPAIIAARERNQLRLMLPLSLIPIALLPAVVHAGKFAALHDAMLLGLLALLAVNLVRLIAKGSRSARFQAAAWVSGMGLAGVTLIHTLLTGGQFPLYLEAMAAALLVEFIISALGVIDGFVLIRKERDKAVADVRAAKIANATDPLTDIANRRGLDHHFSTAGHGHPAGLALIDCDHFKRINDQFGHDVGDRVLVAVAQALQGESQFEARLGGEEFVLLIYAQNWRTIAENARRQITQTVRQCVPELPFPVTASAGLAAFNPSETLAEALKRADRALYCAKDAGRNRSLELTEFRPETDGLTQVA